MNNERRINEKYLKKRKLKYRKQKKQRKMKLIKTALILTCSMIFIGVVWDKVTSTKGKEGDNSSIQIYKNLRTGKMPSEELNTDPSISTSTPDLDLLQIVSLEHPLEHDLDLELMALSNGETIDSVAYGPLKKMLADGEKEGLSFVVCSGYRSIVEQTKLFKDKVKRVQQEGYSEAEAYDIAKQEVAVPGSSEHHLGLTADIVSEDYQMLDDKQADTPEAIWLEENCSNYGFILRYPPDRTDITGIIFEPWHYRYVGVKAAKEIMENSYTLEEYIDKISE